MHSHFENISSKNKYLQYMLSIPCIKYLRPCVLGFKYFWILEYLHIHNEVNMRGDPSPNMSYIPSTHGLKVILYNMFSLPAFWLQPISYEMRYKISHLWHYGSHQKLRFWSISDFTILDYGCSTCIDMKSRSMETSTK
jgi:hypothetical protein